MVFKKGLTPWNKGLTKENDERVRRSAINLSITKKRLFVENPKLIQRMKNIRKKVNPTNMSLAKKEYFKTHTHHRKGKHQLSTRGKNNPMRRPEVIAKCKKLYYENPKWVEKRRKTTKALWENIEFRNKVVKATMKAQHKKPNKTEKKMIILLKKYFPNEFKFVGDGQVILGGKCPDFININGKKLIIEIFGDYWHTKEGIKYHQTEQGTKEHYNKYGFKTLIIWENELKNEEKVINKISSFY